MARKVFFRRGDGRRSSKYFANFYRQPASVKAKGRLLHILFAPADYIPVLEHMDKSFSVVYTEINSHQ